MDNKLKVNIIRKDNILYEYFINGYCVASIKKDKQDDCFWYYKTMEQTLMDWTDRGYNEAKDIVEHSIKYFFERYGIEVEFYER